MTPGDIKPVRAFFRLNIMKFDEQQHRQETLDWYVHLAELPGWKQYVWNAVKVFAKNSPMHHDLPDRLVAAVKARQQLDKAA